MARKKKAGVGAEIAAAMEAVPTVPFTRTILLEDGSEVDVPENTEARVANLEIRGAEYTHVADAPDGRWIYGHRDSRRR